MQADSSLLLHWRGTASLEDEELISRAMKLRIRPGSSLRTELEARRIVVFLHGHKDAITDMWAKQRAIDSGREICEQDSEHIFAISKMTFSPYRPMFFPMERDDAPLHILTADHAIAVQAKIS